MSYTRREFGKIALGCLPAAGIILNSDFAFATAGAKPNSKWVGVQIGLNVPYSFGTRTAMTAEDVLAQCVALNVSGVELRAQAIEKSFGLPDDLVLGPAPSDYYASSTPVGEVPGVPGNEGARGMPGTPEQLAAYEAATQKLTSWRLSVPMSKAQELREKYKESGVAIDIVKFDGLNDMENGELDYAFTLAKTLGAQALSVELSMPSVKLLAQAADSHKMMVGLHGHEAVTPAIWEQAFSCGKYIGANVDIGYFVGGSNASPLPFIKQYQNRITHLHVRDEKMNKGPSMLFGQGDTPIKEILQAIRDNRWPIPGMIEFDVHLPPGTDRMPAIAQCIQYCKDCLVG
jgi:hypothetical protein